MGKTSKQGGASNERLTIAMTERRKETPAGARRAAAPPPPQFENYALDDDARSDFVARLSMQAREVLIRFLEEWNALDDNGRLYQADVDRESGVSAVGEETRQRDLSRILGLLK